MEYGAENRLQDFEYFLKYYQRLFDTFGHKYIAIQNQTILGIFDSITDTFSLLTEHKPGTYIVQECDGTENAYRTNIMRLIIKG